MPKISICLIVAGVAIIGFVGGIFLGKTIEKKNSVLVEKYLNEEMSECHNSIQQEKIACEKKEDILIESCKKGKG